MSVPSQSTPALKAGLTHCFCMHAGVFPLHQAGSGARDASLSATQAVSHQRPHNSLLSRQTMMAAAAAEPAA